MQNIYSQNEMDKQVMRVKIDISKLHKLSQQRGIGFYTRNLIEELKKNDHVDLKVVETTTDNRDCDVLHFPFFDLFRTTLPLSKYANTVVTIHDVIPLVFPQHYPPGIKGRLAFLKQKLSLKNVKAVITDSKASKKDIQKYLGVPENKIFPVYLAPGSQFKKITDENALSRTRSRFSLPDTFVLYTGSVNWNKNLLNIAQATVESGIDLVCVGGGFTTKEDLSHPELKSFKSFMEKFGDNPKVHILGFVENDDLVNIINLAKAVVQCSFYEGFGLPILEAQACGTPVITSNLASMPEVAGSGAILVDPNSSEQIKEAIIKMTSDELFRSNLIKKGFENLENFSWEKTAQETLEVYRYAKNN